MKTDLRRIQTLIEKATKTQYKTNKQLQQPIQGRRSALAIAWWMRWSYFVPMGN
jgi:hypothetical protein